MDRKERLARVFDLQRPDRPPILGGWLAAPNHIQTLTGCSEADYYGDAYHWGLEAERALGSDGVIGVFEPIAGGYRCVDGHTLEARASWTVEKVLEEIAAMPDPHEVEDQFDEEAAYREFLDDFLVQQKRCGDLVLCPPDWGMIPKALWYHTFGYESALTTLALYPDRYSKLIRVSGARARQRAILHARAIREGIRPRAILTGEDICSQQGPMVSPAFLRREYFELVEYALEPVLAAGAKIVWHCDGDYRPLLDDVLACGISGLQGFQPECGMDLEWIVQRRTRGGDPLLIFGPMPVTTVLRFGDVADVETEVQRALDLCRDNASLVFFTSNTINPDVPLENIQAYWRAVLASRW
jgi:hypothetical protein